MPGSPDLQDTILSAFADRAISPQQPDPFCGFCYNVDHIFIELLNGTLPRSLIWRLHYFRIFCFKHSVGEIIDSGSRDAEKSWVEEINNGRLIAIVVVSTLVKKHRKKGVDLLTMTATLP